MEWLRPSASGRVPGKVRTIFGKSRVARCTTPGRRGQMPDKTAIVVWVRPLLLQEPWLCTLWLPLLP
jgi:hypothetical protein